MTVRHLAVMATLIALFGAPPVPAAAQPADSALTLVAGAGGAEFTGDDGPAAEARLNRPIAAAVSADGTLYIADMVNRRLRAVGPDGVIRTVAGNGETAPATGPVPAGTKGTEIPLGLPNTVAVSPDGTVFVADNTASRVYALATDGTISLRADPARLGGPIASITSITVTADGTLYLGDRENNRIVEVPPGASARPVSTPVAIPASLSADATGDVWIASASTLLSRMHDGQVATIVSPSDGAWQADTNRPNTSPFDATAVSAGRDGLYLIDNRERVVRRLNPDGSVSVVAALPTEPFGTNDPVSLAVGTAPDGPLYLIDTQGNRIFSTPVPAADDTGGAESRTGIWFWTAGGAVMLGVLALLARGIRRARR